MEIKKKNKIFLRFTKVRLVTSLLWCLKLLNIRYQNILFSNNRTSKINLYKILRRRLNNRILNFIRLILLKNKRVQNKKIFSLYNLLRIYKFKQIVQVQKFIQRIKLSNINTFLNNSKYIWFSNSNYKFFSKIANKLKCLNFSANSNGFPLHINSNYFGFSQKAILRNL